MFPEVQDTLKLDQNDVAGKRVNLVEEEAGCGDYLIHHFISSAVRADSNVFIVGLDQTFGHYHGVGLKLGNDLLKWQKGGNLLFMDVLKDVHSAYYEQGEKYDGLVNFSERSLAPLSEKIQRQLEKFKDSGKPLTIVVDKLSAFLSLGFPLRDVICLVQRLQCVAYERSATLITLCLGHSSRHLEERYRGEVEIDDLGDSVVAFLDHTSHLTVVVWPLLTGHSDRVTGNLLFSWAPVGRGRVSDFGRYQYSVEEKNVRVFALGSSNAVL